MTEELQTLRQTYIIEAEKKVLSLELERTLKGELGVKVLGEREEVIIPTTEELLSYIQNEGAIRRIRDLEESLSQLSEEKVAIAEQTYEIINSTVKRLDQDLVSLETHLKATGEFQVAGSAKPNDLAAIQVQPNASDWILAKVISHDLETGMYRLSDEDVESNKIFHLPESQVVVLGGIEKLFRGDIVYAVYPDTTSFYQATVVAPPKRVSGGGSFIMVNFVDDADENGITHDKAVLLKHVMRVPYGAIIHPM
jgi:SGF29 tudor-like domain/Inhibitor of growth proteins N-terminal histone-binding